MQRTRNALLLGLLIGLSLGSTASARAESPEARNRRMAWWREARFGLFVHFGVFSLPTETPRQMDNYFTLPLETFLPLADRFNPRRYDPDAWVRHAKSAGMKYLVFVSKSHDGFCLFDSQYTDFDIMNTPYRRDLMKQLADACHRGGLKLGWYYSIIDWHHPDYLPRRAVDKRPAEGADFDRYVEFMKNQLRELLTNYGQVDVLWFDGEWDSSWTPERGQDLERYLRGLRPELVINERVGRARQGQGPSVPVLGDFATPEQEFPGGDPGLDWETCWTMNDHWQYIDYDQNWKSTAAILHGLIDCASKGGNLLLDVGPQPDGVFPQPAVERLDEIGRWMAVHGESVYGTSAGPFGKPPAWGRSTSKVLPNGKTRLYLHVFDWPADGRLVVPGLGKPVSAAWLLSDPQRSGLAVVRDGQDLVVTLPAARPAEVVPVVVLELDGLPRVAGEAKAVQ
jgi:alpha-L-fucosidase